MHSSSQRRFGIEINKDVVRRVLAKHHRPQLGVGGPSWLTLIGHTKDSLWSVDLFRCEAITLKMHWVLVVMDQSTRRIIGFAVRAGPVDAIALCCRFNTVIARVGVPKQLSSGKDPLFTCHRWLASLRILEIDEVKTVPCTPVSHPFVERLIGSIRRELLDQVFFWNMVDLERKLRSFQLYFHHSRTHASLDGDTPAERSGSVATHPAALRNFTWEKHCGGLFELPVAA